MSQAAPPSSTLMFESALRAALYCLHPRVIFLSFLPLLLAAVTLAALGYWGWEAGVSGIRSGLDDWSLSGTMLQWMDRAGLSHMRALLAPLLLLLLAVPLVVILCLLLVGGLMTPSLVRLVWAKRFPGMTAAQQTPWWRSLAWSLGATLMAMSMLVISLPLWWIPLFAVVLPPLIWGWLTYRVMAFDTLADIATPAERQQLLATHRRSLLVMGIVCGYLGAAPTALWALGAMTIILAPILMVASVWIYTLVFAYSSLWFAHYLLPALQTLRQPAGDALSVRDQLSSSS
ncbi:MAG: EI24 domain-containing protein [Aquabacterium sp.]